MSDARRQLSFNSEDDVIAEVDRLRAGGYAKRGNWSLPQICFHLAVVPRKSLKPPASTAPTPAQQRIQDGFIGTILSTGKPPPGMTPPPDMIPADTCGDADIESFKAALTQLKSYRHTHVDFGPMGPVPIETMRKLTLVHSAHHLSHLDPKATRRVGVSYKSEDEVIADVQRLRRGYVQAGAWSLPQMCAHLDKAVQFRMQPGPFAPDTPEQMKKKEQIPGILATGKLPEGIKAPVPMLPPADCGEASIDAFLITIEKYKRFPGPTAPHRIFGALAEPDARKLNLIHCAHHLSYLTPTATS